MWHYSPSYSVFSVGFAASVAWRGHKKKSLSSSGQSAPVIAVNQALTAKLKAWLLELLTFAIGQAL